MEETLDHLKRKQPMEVTHPLASIFKPRYSHYTCPERGLIIIDSEKKKMGTKLLCITLKSPDKVVIFELENNE